MYKNNSYQIINNSYFWDKWGRWYNEVREEDFHISYFLLLDFITSM